MAEKMDLTGGTTLTRTPRKQNHSNSLHNSTAFCRSKLWQKTVEEHPLPQTRTASSLTTNHRPSQVEQSVREDTFSLKWR